MKSFRYQNKKTKNYFEGWYTRLVDKSQNINIAIIFAITKNEKDAHSFIQVYDGVKLTNTYYRFAESDFSYINNEARIKNNVLSPSKLQLDVGNTNIDVTFNNTMKIKKHFGFQSAMSYMKHFPLVCFQEVNILDGQYSGQITSDKKSVKTSGSLYMEKTYGYKFPKKWMWIQGNHFDQEVLLSLSVGYIPILGFYQKGFFAIVSHNEKEYRFGSFNLAHIKIDKTNDIITVTVKKRRLKLIVEIINQDPVKLVGPIDKGEMVLDVFESINATATVTLFKGKKQLFKTKGTHIGFEDMY